MVRRNRIRERLEDGSTAIGARATVIDPTLVELYGTIGLDFVWLDFEHTGGSVVDGPVFENLSRAGEVADVGLLVRLPTGEPHTIRKALDAGIRTVLIPRVEGPAEVRRAVEAARFVYDGGPGTRGNAAARSSGWGNRGEGYATAEDANTCVGVMIESEAAVDAIEEILAVPELGFVFVGPSDLSVSLGHPLETDHPEVAAAIDRIHAAAVDADVPIGRIADEPAAARAAIADGYRILRIGDELSAAREVLGGRLTAIRDGPG